MSDPSARFDMFGPFSASIRNHLGEFADEWMRGRVMLTRNLADRIAAEHDLEKLKELRAELNDVLLSEADIEQADGRMTKMLEMLKRHAQTMAEIRKLRQATPH